MVDRTVKALETWLCDGIELAMTRYNGETDPLDKAAAKPNVPKGPKVPKIPEMPNAATNAPTLPDSGPN